MYLNPFGLPNEVFAEIGRSSNTCFFNCAVPCRVTVVCGGWDVLGFQLVVSNTVLSVLTSTTNNTSLSSECGLASSLGKTRWAMRGRGTVLSCPNRKNDNILLRDKEGTFSYVVWHDRCLEFFLPKNPFNCPRCSHWAYPLVSDGKHG